MSYSYATSDLLARYEISARFVASLTFDPLIVRCDHEHMFELKTFCDDINRFMSPRPYRYFLTHNNSASCQLEYDESDDQKFRLYFFIPHNETHDQIRVYNESTDFVVWDIERDGILVEYVLLNESNFRFKFNDFGRVPYWSQNLAAFGSQSDPRVMTNIFPVVPDNTSEVVDTATGTALFNKDLHQMLKSRTQAKYSHYLLTDIDDHVVLESEIGAVYPVQVENKKPIFPRINELNSSIWNSVYQNVIELPIDISIIVNVSLKQYMIMKRVIYTRSQMSFYLIMLFEIDPIMAELYFPTTMIFTFCALAIISLLFLMRMSLNHLERMIKKKLDLRKKANPLLSFDYKDNNLSIYSTFKRNIHKYCGKIEFAIHRLRGIELKYPEDIMMNNIIDNAVEEMSRTKEELFNIEYEEHERKKNLLISKVINSNINANHNNNNYHLFNNFRYNGFVTNNLNDNTPINNINYTNTVFNLSLSNINIKNIRKNNNGCEFCFYLNKKFPKPKQIKQATNKILPFEISSVMTFSQLWKSNKNNQEQFPKSSSNNEINHKTIIYNCQINDKNQENEGSTKIHRFSAEGNQNHEMNVNKTNTDIPLNCSANISKIGSQKEKDNRDSIDCLNRNEMKPNQKKVTFANNNSSYNSESCSIQKKQLNEKLRYAHPHKYLCLYFLKIIKHSQLFFLEFDPDILIMFELSFTKKYFSNEILHFKIESMRLLKKILITSGNFQIYISSKIDKLILFLSVMTRKNHIFSNYKKKGLNIFEDNSNMNYIKNILREFHSYFFTENDYFDSMIVKLLEETTNNKKMEIFGEFNNRIQSPNFSILKNRNDNFLFLKAIIVFTDFTPYLSKRSCLDSNIFAEIHNIVFAEEERNDEQLIAEFHFEMAQKVVHPWLKMLESISPLNEIRRNLEESTEFWRKHANAPIINN